MTDAQARENNLVTLFRDVKVGDVLVVTGDEAGWEHELPAGHEVVVDSTIQKMLQYDPYKVGDETDYLWCSHGLAVTVKCPGILCRASNHLYVDDGDPRDIALIDLDPPLKPVSEEELQEVYKSLGVR